MGVEKALHQAEILVNSPAYSDLVADLEATLSEFKVNNKTRDLDFRNICYNEKRSDIFDKFVEYIAANSERKDIKWVIKSPLARIKNVERSIKSKMKKNMKGYK